MTSNHRNWTGSWNSVGVSRSIEEFQSYLGVYILEDYEWVPEDLQRSFLFLVNHYDRAWGRFGAGATDLLVRLFVDPYVFPSPAQFNAAMARMGIDPELAKKASGSNRMVSVQCLAESDLPGEALVLLTTRCNTVESRGQRLHEIFPMWSVDEWGREGQEG